MFPSVWIPPTHFSFFLFLAAYIPPPQFPEVYHPTVTVGRDTRGVRTAILFAAHNETYELTATVNFGL